MLPLKTNSSLYSHAPFHNFQFKRQILILVYYDVRTGLKTCLSTCSHVCPHDVVTAGPGPGAVRGQPININAPGSSQTPENVQQMKKLMEQELKSDKYKSNSNKGYVFTLMPLYAIGVGVFAAYKFLKVSKDTCNTKLHFKGQWQCGCKICSSLLFQLTDQVC